MEATKIIIRFEKDYGKDKRGRLMILKVAAFEIETGKNIELQAYLLNKGFRFVSIDADSIRAEMTDNYNIVYQVLQQLQNDGWKWE